MIIGTNIFIGDEVVFAFCITFLFGNRIKKLKVAFDQVKAVLMLEEIQRKIKLKLYV